MIPASSFRPPLAFLITAAGSGTRMGSGPKKEYRKIGSRTVLETTVLSMIEASVFSYGLITCPPGKINQTKKTISPLIEMLEKENISLIYCEGGKERQDSVFLGLKSLAANFPAMLESGVVLIHDGARPWASPKLITQICEMSRTHGGCAPVTPSIDAMKQVSEDGIITNHLPRKQTVSVQTPQGFLFSDILKAHEEAAVDHCSYIDDTEIFSKYSGAVYTVDGETSNKKITYAEDLSL